MKIVNRAARYYIPEEWVPRWELLSNFQSDNEGEAMPLDWDTEELKAWFELNESMRDRSGHVSLSSVHKLIDFMLPSTDTYLLCVKNDLSDRGKRVEAFGKLGMCTAKESCVPTSVTLDRFGVYAGHIQEIMRLPDEVSKQRDKLLKIPYMVLLGIIVNSRETNPLSIDWSDLKSTLFSKESIDAYDEFLEVSSSEAIDERLQALFLKLPSVTYSDDLRLLSGTPIEHPINAHSYSENGWETSMLIIEEDIGTCEDELMDADDCKYSSPENVDKLIRLIGIQVETASVECLAGVIKYMLGLGPILDLNGDYTIMPEDEQLPLYSLILSKMSGVVGRCPMNSYQGTCVDMARALGSTYLLICCGAVRRLLEYHSTINPEEIGRNTHWVVSTIDSDIYSFSLLLKKEDERLRTFLTIAWAVLGTITMSRGFSAWPDGS